MFKLARYFFIVFFITTIIPLVLMFIWNHHQMENMMIDKKQHILNVGHKLLEETSKQYLKLREINALEKLQNITIEKTTFKELQSIFKNSDIKMIYSGNIKYVDSYYKTKISNKTHHPELYNVLEIPFKILGAKGIKITEKVNIAELRPGGPFNVEIFYGEKIDNHCFSQIVDDPFMPIFDEKKAPQSFHTLKPPKFKDDYRDNSFPPMDINHFAPPFPNDRSQNDGFAPKKPFDLSEINSNNIVKISDNHNKTIATLVINVFKPHDMDKPNHRNPFENEIGFIILFAGSVLSVVVGFYINKNFISPLLTLSKGLKQVQQGNFAFELDTANKQEQIQNIFEDFNQTVKMLSEKEKLRQSFITNLTHDLKTPLIAQTRALGLISKEFETLKLIEPYQLSKGIEKNNIHLLRMVELILESYKYDSEILNLTNSEINLSKLINNCYEKSSPLALEKEIKLINSVPENLPLLNGDVTSFERVFINLISNSIDNLAQNGKIEISAETVDNFIQIYVEDNGTSIAEEDLMFIFDRHYTGKSCERKLGSGLGLYVCKKLIETHKGEITLNSEVNKYTKFTIKLPLENQKDKK